MGCGCACECTHQTANGNKNGEFQLEKRKENKKREGDMISLSGINGCVGVFFIPFPSHTSRFHRHLLNSLSLSYFFVPKGQEQKQEEQRLVVLGVAV